MTKTEITVGKVKTIFSTDKPDEVIIQYEDRVTAGNGEKDAIIEGKVMYVALYLLYCLSIWRNVVFVLITRVFLHGGQWHVKSYQLLL